MISFKVSAQESKPVKSQNSRACAQFFSGLLMLRANNPL